MRKGFTLMELLAVLIVLGLLIILTIPAYTGVYTQVKRSNLNSKLNEVKAAALKHGETVKDDIKASSGSCGFLKHGDLKNGYLLGEGTGEENIAYLVTNGYLVSDLEDKPALLSPVDNKELKGDVVLCYCLGTYELEAYYTQEFNEATTYYVGDYISHNKKVYLTKITYNPQSKDKKDETSPQFLGIDAINYDNDRFFEVITCE